MAEIIEKMSWSDKTDELGIIVAEINNDDIAEADELLSRLHQIFGDSDNVYGVDHNVIYLIEFCFFKAEGPYSKKFDYYAHIMSKVFKLYPPIKRLLDYNAEATLGNMVLGARGKLKFVISDYYELIRVLNVWEEMGLYPKSPGAVLRGVLNKRVVQERLEAKDPYLMASLKQIFPKYYDEFIPKDMDLDTEIYEQQKKRFETVLEDYRKEGLSIEEMIKRENLRKLPNGVKRNNLLSYLIKKKHNFKCQVCTCLGISKKDQVQSHHIVHLYSGGEDHSNNIIILCNYHHDLVHLHKLEIDVYDQVVIEHEGETYYLNLN